MRYHREAVVDRALRVLDDYGLADLTMRRLGSELGVQPSALYHHFRDKQALLAAVADELLVRGRRPRTAEGWEGRVAECCAELRDAMLAYRDGAEVVAAARALGLGARGPGEEIESTLTEAGLDASLAAAASRTLLIYVVGHTVDAQTHQQAGSVGAIADDPRGADDFDLGLGLLLAGLRAEPALTALRPGPPPLRSARPAPRPR